MPPAEQSTPHDPDILLDRQAREHIKSLAAVATLHNLEQTPANETLTAQSAALLRIKEAHMLTGADRALAMVRLRRERGLGAVNPDPGGEAAALDDAIAYLLDSGEESLAAELMTVNTAEYARLHKAVRRTVPADRQAHILQDIETDLHRRSDRLLQRVGAALHGKTRLSAEDMTHELQTHCPDPELTTHLSPESVHELSALPKELRRQVYGSPELFEHAVDAAVALSEAKAEAHADALLNPLSRLPDPGTRRAYIHSFRNAVAMLGPHERSDTGLLKDLAAFADPLTMLASVRHTYGSAGTAKHLERERQLFGIDGQSDAPLAVKAHDYGTRLRVMRAGAKLYEGPASAADEWTGSLTRLIRLGGRNGERYLRSIEVLADELPNNRLHKSDFGLISARPEITRIAALAGHDVQAARVALRRLGMKAAFVHQAGELLRADAAAQNQGDPRHEVTLDGMPVFSLFMDELGIPEEYHLAFLKPWLSTSPLEMGRIEHKTKGDLSADQLRDGATLATGNAYEQASALQHYVERYGLEEALDVHETFGIVNFARGSAELLHDQLERWKGRMVEDTWKDGRGHTETRMRRECDQPQWINIAATDSDNPALHKRFDSIFSKLGPHGFVFEAAAEKQLAQAAVKVGNRERMAWRDPSAAGGGVRLVIVSAHGTPSSLYLSEGHELRIKDYAFAHQGRRDMEAARAQHGGRPAGVPATPQVAPNTFTRHLGWQHELVLDACATGGESELYTYNLATVMAYGHRGRVTGAPVNIVDFIVKDGQVAYKLLSGREVSGVTVDMTRQRSDRR